MILKEDITVSQTTRLPSSSPLVLPTLRGGLPSTVGSEESVPWYRPPSMPPPARINGADPAPWRVDPPPRYRVKKRAARFFPLAFALTWSSMLLGTTVNFIVESIILIATTHVRKGLFDIFRQILIPSYILIASSAMCIVIYPIHHVIPFPGPATTSFRASTPRYKFYKITRMALPLLVLVVQLVGVVYFLAVALTKAGNDTDKGDTSIPLGNGHELKLDPQYPKEGQIMRKWEEWFFGDRNVKLVVTAAVLSILSSILFTFNAVETTYIHRCFTGEPPRRVRAFELKLSRWWSKRMAGGYDGEEGEEMMTEPRNTGIGMSTQSLERAEEETAAAVEEGHASRRFGNGSRGRLGIGGIGFGKSLSVAGLGGVLKDRLRRKRAGPVMI